MTDQVVNPPIDLTERFCPEDEPVFEALRAVGDLRLWKSIAKGHPLSEEANRPNIRYHITQGDMGELVGVGRLEMAIQNFELCAQGVSHA